MDTVNAPRLCNGLTALAAVAEDAAGIGLDIGPALEGRLHRLARGGIGLPRPVARTLGREFEFDLGRIRLHLGPEVDAIADGLNTSAFCLGVGIFLSRSVLECGGAVTLDILRHELTHVAAGPVFHRIRCWNDDIHSKLTEDACHAFRPALERLLKNNKGVKMTGGVNGLIKGLAIASSNMDVRRRFVISHAKYWGDLVFKSGLTKMHLRHVIAGEGPAHGEGKDYRDPDWQKNTDENVKTQNGHIDLAVAEFKKDQDSWLDDVLPEVHVGKIPIISAIIGPVTLLEKEWVKSLANALHIAQDRASHREGVQGYGHDDDRADWNPDLFAHDHTSKHPDRFSWKRCSVAAYNKALNNCYEVMRKFLSALGPDPGIPPSKPVECSFSVPGLEQFDLGTQCVHGRLPGPLGFQYYQSASGRRPGPLGVHQSESL